MVILLLLVTMGVTQAAHSTLSLAGTINSEEKEGASIVSVMPFPLKDAFLVEKTDTVRPAHAYVLRRTCSLSSPTSPQTPNTPVAYPKYMRRYPDPISIWTDEDIDKYFRAWGPRDYYVYAMRLFHERYVNRYGEPHINDKST